MEKSQTTVKSQSGTEGFKIRGFFFRSQQLTYKIVNNKDNRVSMSRNNQSDS